MHTPEIDGFGCRETDTADAWRNRGHKESVLAVSDGCTITIFADDGAGNELAARGGKKAAAVEECNALERFTATVGTRQIIVGISAVCLIIILHIGLHDSRVVCFSKQICKEWRAHPIVVIKESEIRASSHVDGEISRIRHSWRRSCEELNVEAILCSLDIVSNLRVIRLHIAVEDENHLEVLSRKSLLLEAFECFPKVFLGMICRDNDGDEHFYATGYLGGRGTIGV